MNHQAIRRAACLALCCALLAAGAAAETLAFGGVTVDSGAEYVDMGGTVIADWEGFYAFLAGLPRLRAVDLFATEIRPGRIEELHERFPQVTFGMTMRIQEHVLRTDATAFSTLHTASSPAHWSEELAVVRYCTNLYALDLGHNRLTDLSFLYELPELRVLIIAMSGVTDLTPVGSLKHLEYLEAFDNRIPDISCLAGLPYLMDLNLAVNRIGDLTPVTELPRLQRLWMRAYQTTLPAEQLAREAEGLRQALPGCTVDEVSFGIGGAWREGPHYEVIRRMFRSGVYEPFADSPMENLPAALRVP